MPDYSVQGGATEVAIDHANIAMRGMPWYQNQMRAWGQDPGHPTLTDAQRTQMTRLAQANGFVVDEGNIEMDDHGNFNPIGHKLRNTLLVAGVAAATIATMGAAGVFSSGAAAGAGATGASGISTVGAGSAGAGIAGAGGAAGAVGAGMSYADLLKYGLPVAGNLVGGLIQAKASSSASDAQQKYLEEALAYQKEQDAYARSTDASRYADSRGDLAAALAKEENRYAGYQGRIAPYIANGTTSNDRMAALLGLPARPASTSPSGGYASRPMDDTRSVDVGNAPSMFYAAMQDAGLNPVAVQGHGQTIVDAINKKYPGLGATVDPRTDAVVWPGIGPLDVTVDSGKGGWSFRPSGDGSYVAPAKPYTAPVATAAPVSPSPLAPAAPVAASTVQMRAPDGSVRAINQSDVPHFKSLGATVIGAA